MDKTRAAQMEKKAASAQTLPEPEGVQLALREIAQAREHLRLAGDALNALGTTEAAGEAPAAVSREGRQLDIGNARDFLDIAQKVIQQVFPEQLAQRALQDRTNPRDWLYRVYTVSCAPRGISEPVTTLVVMLAAVKFGLRHQLLLQTETRLGITHKTPIPNLDLFLETFVSEMIEADRSEARLNDWLQQTIAEHYPSFRNGKHLDLPNGDYVVIPEAIEPIRQQAAGPIAASALTSPVNPASHAIIPAGSGWRITLGYAEVLRAAAFPAFNGKHHSGIDLYRWDARHKPIYAMRPGKVIDSVYLPKGFGNTVVIEHDDGTCLRYTHLDKKLAAAGDRVARGQQIGTVGKGANNIYAPHLHLDMPRSSAYARATTYYDTPAEVADRFINPLSQIAAAI
ncbi:MAG: M23 family metallopeptidase [Chloroflexota bacterium]|nr:M23 family metallopeptidase [Chloroflexota bacterium]MDE2908685.1 M23 family metallopeptidase [Chloroflexota bacterium]